MSNSTAQSPPGKNYVQPTDGKSTLEAKGHTNTQEPQIDNVNSVENNYTAHSSLITTQEGHP